MVFGSISEVDTPPLVIIASSRGRKRVTVSVRFFNSPTRTERSSRVIELTFFAGGMPDSLTITGISFCGSRSESAFAKSRFQYLRKSARTRLSSFSASSAGFRSSRISYFPGVIFASIADALSIIGPVNPK